MSCSPRVAQARTPAGSVSVAGVAVDGSLTSCACGDPQVWAWGSAMSREIPTRRWPRRTANVTPYGPDQLRNRPAVSQGPCWIASVRSYLAQMRGRSDRYCPGFVTCATIVLDNGTLSPAFSKLVTVQLDNRNTELPVSEFQTTCLNPSAWSSSLRACAFWPAASAGRTAVATAGAAGAGASAGATVWVTVTVGAGAVTV